MTDLNVIHTLDDLMIARQMTVRMSELAQCLSMLWIGPPNVNWEAQVRREILYMRRKLDVLESNQKTRGYGPL